jgi:hypothetical protein
MGHYGAWQPSHVVGNAGHRRLRVYQGGYIQSEHHTDDHIVWAHVYGIGGRVLHIVAWDAWNPTIRARSKGNVHAAVEAVRQVRDWHRLAQMEADVARVPA